MTTDAFAEVMNANVGALVTAQAGAGSYNGILTCADTDLLTLVSGRTKPTWVFVRTDAVDALVINATAQEVQDGS
jgi:succinate dehydrogenase flavin-adding protein (antitoxin of CptAB toxin-antitoxin module)